MDKRVRSPNYPSLSLPDAIDKVTALYKNLHTHAGPREVIAKGMGYNSLNGASASAISALHKYGLLEKLGDEVKVSDRALRILHPHTPDERAEAIYEAAKQPALFVELAERFPGRLPSEELLRNYLVRKGFAPGAVSQVILAYRETSEFAGRETSTYDSRVQPSEEPEMATATSPESSGPQFLKQIKPLEGRQLGRYDFEGGAFVQIVAGGQVDTETALDMLETLIDLKRKELKRGKPQNTAESTDTSEGNEDEYSD